MISPLIGRLASVGPSASSTPPTVTPQVPTPPAPAPAVRPKVEWWEAGGEKFDSTTDLVSRFKPAAEGTRALYHWRPETRPNLRAAALAGAEAGGFAGAMLGGGTSEALICLEGLGASVLPGYYSLPVWLVAFAPMVIGAGAGALFGAAAAPASQWVNYQQGTVINGMVHNESRTDGNHLEYYVGADKNNKVDLNEFAKAPTGPIPPDSPAPWWLSQR